MRRYWKGFVFGAGCILLVVITGYYASQVPVPPPDNIGLRSGELVRWGTTGRIECIKKVINEYVVLETGYVVKATDVERLERTKRKE